MLLDIGAGNIEIGVFEGNKFVYTNTISLRRRYDKKRYRTCFRYIRRGSGQAKKTVWLSFEIIYR